MHVNQSALEMNSEQRRIQVYIGAFFSTLIFLLLIIYFICHCCLWCSKKYAAAKKKKEENPQVNQYHRFKEEGLYSLLDDPKEKILISHV